MQTAEELVKYSDRPDPAVLKALEQREKLIFWKSNEATGDTSNWESLLYPATKLDTAIGTYYYSYITQPSAFDLDTSKIVSYKAYLENQ